MNNVTNIPSDIVNVGRALLKKGLVAGTWGNISARISGRPIIAITPSGREYDTLTADDIVLVDSRTGAVVSGKHIPSTELPLHLAIYQARPQVNAVVHTHSVFASACAVARRAIPPLIEDLIQAIGGRVEVADYALPGSQLLAEAVVRALGDKNAALMANHGAIVCGPSLAETVMYSEIVEKAAQILVYSTQLGGYHILAEADVQAMRSFYTEQYSKRRGG